MATPEPPGPSPELLDLVCHTPFVDWLCRDGSSFRVRAAQAQRVARCPQNLARWWPRLCNKGGLTDGSNGSGSAVRTATAPEHVDSASQAAAGVPSPAQTALCGLP